MKKRMLAWLLVVAMMLGQVPVSAFAVETTPVTGEQSATEPAKATEAKSTEPTKAGEKSTEPTKAGEKSTEPTKAGEETKSTGATEETGATEPSESTGETGAPTEETGAPTEETTAPTEETTEPTEAVDEAVAAVEGAIAALPALDVLETLDEAAQNAAYEQAQSIADAYDALTEEQQGKVSNFETLVVFLNWFAVPETMGYVAQIEGQRGFYTSFNDALYWIKQGSGNTIVLCDNATFAFEGDKTGLIIANPKFDTNLTIKLKGHTLYADGSALCIEVGSNVTIEGSGRVFDKDTLGMGILNLSVNNGTLTLTGGVETERVYADGSATIRVQNAGISTLKVNNTSDTLYVEGGTIGNLTVSAAATVNLTGGNFTKITREGSAPTFSEMLYDDNYEFQYTSSGERVPDSAMNGTTLENVKVASHTHDWKDGTCTGCKKTCDHFDGDFDSETGKCSTCGEDLSVATLTHREAVTHCRSFQEACDRAVAGDTIALTKDTESSVYTISKSITIQLNEKKLTLNTDMSVTVLDDSSAVNVTISGKGNVSGQWMNVHNATLTLDGGATIEDVSVGEQGHLKVTDATVENLVVKLDGQLTVTGGTITSLDVNDTARPTLTGGNFTTITRKGSAPTFSAMLADGYEFRYTSNNTRVPASELGEGKTTLSNVTVARHTHTWKNGTCTGCEEVCAHKSIDSDTGKCKTCDIEYAVKLLMEKTSIPRVVAYYSDFTSAVAEVISSDYENNELRLYKDQTYSGALSFANYVTLELNGHTLTTGGITISNGTLGVYGGTNSGAGSGTLGGNITAGTGGHIWLSSGATVDGTVTFSENSPDCILTGVTVKQGVKTTAAGVQLADYLLDGTAFTVNGSVVNANVTALEGLVSVVAHATHTFDDNGKCPCGFACDHSGFISLSGWCSACNKAVSVATITTPVDDRIPNGLTETIHYLTFKDAYTDAKDGNTITLRKDAEWDSNYLITKDITIELNDHTLKVGSSSLWVGSSAEVTFRGPGSVSGSSLTVVGNSTVTLDGGVTVDWVDVNTSGQLTVADATVKKLSLREKGQVTVTGGEITAWTVESSYAQATLSGGKFGSIKRNSDAPAFSAMLKEGYAFQDSTSKAFIKLSELTGKTELKNVTVAQCTHGDWKDVDGKYTCGYCGFVCTHTDSFDSTTGKCKTCQTDLSVAKVNSTYYQTFHEACGEVDNGDTLTLTNDITLHDDADLNQFRLLDNTVWQKNFTFDLGGHTLSTTEKSVYADITGEVTITNGTFDNISIYTGNKLTLENVCAKNATVGCSGDTELTIRGQNTDIATLLCAARYEKVLKLTVESGKIQELQFNSADTTAVFVQLSGGTYGKIVDLYPTHQSHVDLKTLLATGYAYQKEGQLLELKDIPTSETGLTNVTVVKCGTHSYVNAKCVYCGTPCAHPNMNATTGYCAYCGTQMAAMVTSGDGATALTTYCLTLQEAMQGLTGGETVKLLADVAENVTLPSLDFTLDLNGHKINGTVNHLDDSKVTTVVDSSSTGYIKDLYTYGGGNTFQLYGGSYGTIETGATYAVSSCIPTGYALKNSTGAYILRTDLTGYKVENVTVAKCTTHGAPTDDGLCGYCGTKLEASVTMGKTTTYYASFTDALSYVNSSTASTTVLMPLRDLPNSGKQETTGTFTLDLNGKDLGLGLGLQLISAGGDVTIKDSGTDGIVTSVAANKNGKVTLDSGAVGTLSLDGGTITINGGKVNRELDVVAGNNQNGTYDNTLKITGGVIESINIWTDVSLTITGGTVKGLGVGQNLQPGESIKVTSAISGGTFGGIANYIGTVGSLLKDGYAFYGGTEYTQLVNGAVKELNGSYQVKSHTHSYENGSDTCDCGYVCPHTTVTDNKCTVCDLTFVAQLWRDGNQVGWLTSITDEFGLISRVGTIEDGDTIRLMQDYQKAITIDKAVVLDLNHYNCGTITVESTGATILDSTVKEDEVVGGQVECLNLLYSITLGKGTSYGKMSGNFSYITFPEGCGLYKQDSQNQLTWVQTVEENTPYVILKNPTNDWTITFKDEDGNPVKATELVYGKTYTATATPGTYVPTGATISYQWRDDWSDDNATRAISIGSAITLVGSINQQSVKFKATSVSGRFPLIACKITVNGFEISKAEALKVNQADIPADAYTAPKANTLVYKGMEQQLVTAGTVDSFPGHVDYKLEGGQWSTEIPKKMDAGEYKVYWRIVSSDAAYKTYEPKDPITVTITNDWQPKEGREFTITPTANAEGWVKENPTITAKDGYQLSTENTAVGNWEDCLISSMDIDGSGARIPFYVKDTKTGAISQQVVYTFNLDRNQESTKTDATVSFSNGSSWGSFYDANLVSFGQLFNQAVTVTVKAKDLGSGVATIQYAESDKPLTLEQVKDLDNWSFMSTAEGTDDNRNIIGTKTVAAENGKQFVCYIRITDAVGNVTYLSTNGATFDTQAPTITGVTDGETAYTTRVVQITDTHLDKVTLDGETKTLTDGKLTLPGNVEKTYTIVATDKVENATTVTVKMLPISSITADLDDLTVDNVNSGHGSKLRSAKDKIQKEQENTNASPEEKESLKEKLDWVNKLLDKLDEVAKAMNTDNIQKVKDITADNVKLEDKTDLEKAKADLNKALKDYDKNLTEAEKKTLNEKIDTIDKALKAIENVENVEKLIGELPKTITGKDSKAVKAAEDAYNALTTHEKELVSSTSLKKLQAARKTLNRLNGDPTSPNTGDESHVNIWFTTLILSAAALVLLKKRKVVS